MIGLLLTAILGVRCTQEPELTATSMPREVEPAAGDLRANAGLPRRPGASPVPETYYGFLLYPLEDRTTPIGDVHFLHLKDVAMKEPGPQAVINPGTGAPSDGGTTGSGAHSPAPDGGGTTPSFERNELLAWGDLSVGMFLTAGSHGFQLKAPNPGDHEDGKGAHALWLPHATHRRGAAESLDFDPIKDHLGDFRPIQMTYDGSYARSSFAKDLRPWMTKSVAPETCLPGNILVVDNHDDADADVAAPAVLGFFDSSHVLRNPTVSRSYVTRLRRVGGAATEAVGEVLLVQLETSSPRAPRKLFLVVRVNAGAGLAAGMHAVHVKSAINGDATTHWKIASGSTHRKEGYRQPSLFHAGDLPEIASDGSSAINEIFDLSTLYNFADQLADKHLVIDAKPDAEAALSPTPLLYLTFPK